MPGIAAPATNADDGARRWPAAVAQLTAPRRSSAASTYGASSTHDMCSCITNSRPAPIIDHATRERHDPPRQRRHSFEEADEEHHGAGQHVRRIDDVGREVERPGQREERRPDQPARHSRAAGARGTTPAAPARRTTAGSGTRRRFRRGPDREWQADQPAKERARHLSAGPHDVRAEVRPLAARERLQTDEVDLPLVLEPERHGQAVKQPERRTSVVRAQKDGRIASAGASREMLPCSPSNHDETLPLSRSAALVVLATLVWRSSRADPARAGLDSIPRAEWIGRLDRHERPDRIRTEQEPALARRAADGLLVADSLRRSHLRDRRARQDARHARARSRERQDPVGAQRAGGGAAAGRQAQQSRRRRPSRWKRTRSTCSSRTTDSSRTTPAGKELWKLPLGPFNNIYGMGASPVIHGDLLLLAVDQSTGSHLLALDKRTGKERWKTPRPEATSGHATPIIWRAPGRTRSDSASRLVPAHGLRSGRRQEALVGARPVVGNQIHAGHRRRHRLRQRLRLAGRRSGPEDRPAVSRRGVEDRGCGQGRRAVERRVPEGRAGDKTVPPAGWFGVADLDKNGTICQVRVGIHPRGARVRERHARDPARRQRRHDRQVGHLEVPPLGAAAAVAGALQQRAVHGERRRHRDVVQSRDRRRDQAGPAHRRARQLLRVTRRRRRPHLSSPASPASSPCWRPAAT